MRGAPLRCSPVADAPHARRALRDRGLASVARSVKLTGALALVLGAAPVAAGAPAAPTPAPTEASPAAAPTPAGHAARPVIPPLPAAGTHLPAGLPATLQTGGTAAGRTAPPVLYQAPAAAPDRRHRWYYLAGGVLLVIALLRAVRARRAAENVP